MADGTSLTIKRTITVRAVVTPRWKEEAERELTESKRALEEHLGHPIRAYAYVKGGAADFGDRHQAMLRRGDARLIDQPHRDRFPGLQAVVVGFFWKLGDIQRALRVDHGGFRARPTQRRARRKDELQVFVGFFVAQYSFGDLQQAAQLD